MPLTQNQARIKIGDLHTEITKETAGADVELMRVMQKKEQTKDKMEIIRRK